MTIIKRFPTGSSTDDEYGGGGQHLLWQGEFHISPAAAVQRVQLHAAGAAW